MKLKYMDPETIMSVVISLIILAIGIFAFFITITNIPVVVQQGNITAGHVNSATTSLQNSTYQAIINASATGNSVFNIIGIVLIIGAIMTIVGLVYSYMKPKY